MPINFYVIVFAQLFMFLCIYFRYKDTKDSIWKLVTASALFGLVLGITFDFIFGMLGVFSYKTNDLLRPTYPFGLTFFQYVINGILSYGLAVATAYFLISKKTKHEIPKELPKKKVVTILSVGVLFLSSLVVLLSDPGLLSLFACGLSIIGLGELILILQNRQGIILTMVTTKNLVPFFRIWIMAALIGLICEGVNYIFPFWVWLPGLGYSHTMIEALIVVFGYFALFHPMITFWQIIKNK